MTFGLMEASIPRSPQLEGLVGKDDGRQGGASAGGDGGAVILRFSPLPTTVASPCSKKLPIIMLPLCDLIFSKSIYLSS